MQRYRLPCAVLIAPLLFGAVYAVYGQAGPAHAESMPGLQMPQAGQTAAPGTQMPPGYAEVGIAQEVQQRIGVRLGRVEQAELKMTVRTVGIVQPDETRVAHVHVKTEGWVDKLFVSYIGQKIKAGQPMLSIYSPALFAAEQEFVAASRSAKSNLEGNLDRQTVAEAARRRLELWDVPKGAIEALDQTTAPGKSLMLASPITGTVMEKGVFSGQYVMAQSDLYVIADLSTVWVQAKVFEYELPYVEPGMPATVTFASLPDRQFSGKVAFVDPVVDEMSRSVRVRIELPNPDGRFRPGMFANVAIVRAMGSGMTVPTSAVIRTGERDLAFRAIAVDRFAPVEVKINPVRFEDRYQVLEGLKPGDAIVTSANFLIDSESRLEGGGGGMAGMTGMGGDAQGAQKPAARPDAMTDMTMPGGADGQSAPPAKR
ncbi:MAG: efflux RND transporter periplasmic adaptor subunit [Nevskia sp.]|nr:efflux RND transporter periplasmic adaptor subunit [Nevskia sp.]